METHNKLLQQFKDAAAQDEMKPFAASEKVWQQIEGKLDNEKRQFIPWRRYASIAAVVLILVAIGIVMQLNRTETDGREMARMQPAGKTDNIAVPDRPAY